MALHVYNPESGWCSCGHHRDDGRRDNEQPEPLSIAEIRSILGPTYQPKETR